MGSWYATCGISGLPIRGEDEVISMVIMDQSSFMPTQTPSGPWACCQPASLIVRGKYSDDYIIPDMTSHMEDRMALTQKISVLPVFGKVDFEPFKMAFHQDDGSPFSIWSAHADIFDAMADTKSIIRWGEEDQSPNDRTAKIRDTIGSILASSDLSSPLRYNRHLLRLGSELSFGPAMRYLEFAIDGGESAGIAQMMAKHDIGGTAVDYAIDAYLELITLYIIQDNLRQTLYPTGSCGSQDLDTVAHAALAEATLSKIAQRAIEDAVEY